jgi:hypothetical protein
MHRGVVFGYLATAAICLSAVLLTVNRRTTDELQHNLFAQRTHWVVTFWQTHGYFASGGMIALPPAAAGRNIGNAPFFFYRSSTGAWDLPALMVENLARAAEERYDWVLIARMNLLIPALSAVLLALLCNRIALRLGLAPLHAFCLGAAVLALHFTFPDALSLFWELSPQALAMPFFLAFLLLQDGCIEGLRLRRIMQGIVVFGMVYSDLGTSPLLIASFFVVCLVLQRGRLVWREWLTGIVAPAAAALLVFALQLTVVHVRHPSIPLVGSSVISRSGLDGDTTYYRDHLDIIFGRDRARALFPLSRAPLFRWPALFAAGVASMIALLIFHVRWRLPASGFVPLATLTGAYVLYAALFSQATAIHPYYMDYVLVTPIILALFGYLPAVAESLTGSRGVFVLVTLFAAVWYTMVQLRDYALRYPLV